MKTAIPAAARDEILEELEGIVGDYDQRVSVDLVLQQWPTTEAAPDYEALARQKIAECKEIGAIWIICISDGGISVSDIEMGMGWSIDSPEAHAAVTAWLRTKSNEAAKLAKEA